MDLRVSHNLATYPQLLLINQNTKVAVIPKGSKFMDFAVDYNQANQHLESKGNVGIILGNHLIGFDCDDIRLAEAVRQLLPSTYEEETTSGGYHFYFECSEEISQENDKLMITYNRKDLGELKLRDGYFIIAPSKAPSKKDGSIQSYKVISDKPVARVSKAQIMKVLNHFSSSTLNNGTDKVVNVKLDDNIITQLKSDVELWNLISTEVAIGERSNAEESLIGKLISRGFDKETIFKIMAISKIGKWKEKPLSYRNMTYDKAVALVTTSKTGWDNGKNETLPEEIPLLTFKDYKNVKERKDWIIEDLGYYPCEIVQNVGKPSSFKTLDLLLKAVCIASGKPYLNKFRTRKQPVLIISAEESEYQDSQRLKSIARGLGIRKLENLYVIPRRANSNILNPSFREKLIKIIREKNIKILFIDSINPVSPGIDDNSASDVIKVFNEFLKPFADQHNLHIEYLMHTDKRGRDYLGSVKWKGNSDIEWFYERKDTLMEYKISNTKGRSGEIESLRISVVRSDDNKVTKFVLMEQKGVGRKEVHKYSKVEKAKFSIKKALKDKSLSFTDLEKEVLKDNHSEYSFKQARKELETQEVIVKVDGGYKLQ